MIDAGKAEIGVDKIMFFFPAQLMPSVISFLFCFLPSLSTPKECYLVGKYANRMNSWSKQ